MSNFEIVREVQSVAPEGSYVVAAKAVRRELEQRDPSTGESRLVRVVVGKYLDGPEHAGVARSDQPTTAVAREPDAQ